MSLCSCIIFVITFVLILAQLGDYFVGAYMSASTIFDENEKRAEDTSQIHTDTQPITNNYVHEHILQGFNDLFLARAKTLSIFFSGVCVCVYVFFPSFIFVAYATCKMLML